MDADEREAVYLEAATRALAQFPVAVRSVKLIGVSENVTFRVSLADHAGDYALRLHRPGYNSLAELESERDWTAALQAAGVRVQAGLRTRQSQHFCRIAIPSLQEQRYAGMTSWLPGVPLSDMLEQQPDPTSARRAYRDIGQLAASMHRQSAGWRKPPGFARPRLDSDGLLGEQPRWGRFWDHPALSAKDRRLLLAAREHLRQRLDDYGRSADRFGLIHADLHSENIIVHGEELSVIDFDDAAHGWYAYDLATALIDHWGQADCAQLSRAMLAGYRQLRPLSPADEAMLPLFLLLRGMAVIGWLYERPEHAGSGYFAAIRAQVMDACRQLPGIVAES